MDKKKCENSFQKLKKILITSLVLALPNPNRHYVIFCDAYKKGLECVFMQDRRIVTYASKQLKKHEKVAQPLI